MKRDESRELLDCLLDKAGAHTAIRIPRTIFNEVRRNVSTEAFVEFNEFINALTTVDEDFVVSFETVFKYEAKGLKPADAFIAAYTEWTDAEVLVSENRHFLIRHDNLPFRVLTAEKCLHLIKHL